MSLRFQKCRRDPSVSLVSAFPQSCTWQAQKFCEGKSQKLRKVNHKSREKASTKDLRVRKILYLAIINKYCTSQSKKLSNYI